MIPTINERKKAPPSPLNIPLIIIKVPISNHDNDFEKPH